MIEVAAIDHLVLRVTDLQPMLTFYRDILGCPVERELPELGLTQLRAGHALIDLVTVAGTLGAMGGAAPTATENNLDHFCLQIKPLPEAELADYLRKQGVEVGEFGERYGAQGMGRSVYINDPQGNVVELRVQINR